LGLEIEHKQGRKAPKILTFDRLPFFLFVFKVVEGDGVYHRFSKGGIELSSGAGE